MRRAKERAPRCVGMTFTDELVRAIIRGDKLETRRPLVRSANAFEGDELYVRECWTPVDCLFGSAKEGATDIAYRSTKTVIAHESEVFECDAYGIEWGLLKWHPAIHMPKWAARIFLSLVEVRDEHLHCIDEVGSKHEGMLSDVERLSRFIADHQAAVAVVSRRRTARECFIEAWDSIYGETGNAWSKNPLVRVYRWEKSRLLC